jgi:hypothetical protein
LSKKLPGCFKRLNPYKNIPPFVKEGERGGGFIHPASPIIKAAGV